MASNYQMVYGGLTFGMDTAIGVEVIQGFEDFDVRIGDSPIPRGWGDVPGLHTVNSREVTLQLNAATLEDFEEILDTFQPTDTATPLYLTEPTFGERFVYARPIGRAFTRNPLHKFKHMVTIRLKLADPRLYGAQHVHAIPLYDSGGGGGAEYDFDYGIDFVGSATGDTTVTNGGNIDAYPTIVIFAPSSGTTLTATMTNLTTGQLAEFTFSTDLNPGDIFTADMRRIVVVDPGDTPYIRLGATNRYGDWDLPRSPFAIVPGANDLRFEISGSGPDVSASVTFRDSSL
jgi:hypothetical protein